MLEQRLRAADPAGMRAARPFIETALEDLQALRGQPAPAARTLGRSEQRLHERLESAEQVLYTLLWLTEFGAHEAPRAS